VRDATLLTLGASHLANIESADGFSRHLEWFLMLNEQAQRYGATL
jgi:hypothetical protein